MLTNTFQFPEYLKQLSNEIRRTCTLKQSVTQILKTNNMTCFSFHVLCPFFKILNLVMVSKINPQWSCLLAFSYPRLQAIQIGKTFDGKN